MNPEAVTNHESASQEIYAQLNEQERKGADVFEAGLARSKEYMFELATSVVDAYPERQWNVIIGDDTSGRLPTRFIRKSLELKSIDLPVNYVMAGSEARKAVPLETYRNYVEEIAAAHDGPLSPLIVTESAGTYMTTNFLHDLLKPVSNTVDLAVVGATTPSDNFDHLYAGGIGEAPAAAVMDTFEVPSKEGLQNRIIDFARRHTSASLRSTLKSHTNGAVNTWRPASESGHLTNLDNRPEGLPVASLTEDTSQRLLANYCYKRMDELAGEFSREYDVNQLKTIAQANLPKLEDA